MNATCRTCFVNIPQGKPYFALDESDSSNSSGLLKAQLEYCVPEVAVHIVKDPVLCVECLDALGTTYRFKQKCLNTEKKIKDYLQERDLNGKCIEVADIVKWINIHKSTSKYKRNNVQTIPTKNNEYRRTKVVSSPNTNNNATVINIDDDSNSSDDITLIDYETPVTCNDETGSNTPKNSTEASLNETPVRINSVLENQTIGKSQTTVNNTPLSQAIIRTTIDYEENIPTGYILTKSAVSDQSNLEKKRKKYPVNNSFELSDPEVDLVLINNSTSVKLLQNSEASNFVPDTVEHLNKVKLTHKTLQPSEKFHVVRNGAVLSKTPGPFLGEYSRANAKVISINTHSAKSSRESPIIINDKGVSEISPPVACSKKSVSSICPAGEFSQATKSSKFKTYPARPYKKVESNIVVNPDLYKISKLKTKFATISPVGTNPVLENNSPRILNGTKESPIVTGNVCNPVRIGEIDENSLQTFPNTLTEFEISQGPEFIITDVRTVSPDSNPTTLELNNGSEISSKGIDITPVIDLTWEGLAENVQITGIDPGCMNNITKVSHDKGESPEINTDTVNPLRMKEKGSFLKNILLGLEKSKKRDFQEAGPSRIKKSRNHETLPFYKKVSEVKNKNELNKKINNSVQELEKHSKNGIILESDMEIPSDTTMCSDNREEVLILDDSLVRPIEIDCKSTEDEKNDILYTDDLDFKEVDIKKVIKDLDEQKSLEEIATKPKILKQPASEPINIIGGMTCHFEDFCSFEQQYLGYTMEKFYTSQLVALPECSVVLTPLSEMELKKWTRETTKIECSAVLSPLSEMEFKKWARETEKIENPTKEIRITRFRSCIAKKINHYQDTRISNEDLFFTLPPNRRFKCGQCNFQSNYFNSLKIHMKLHFKTSSSAIVENTRQHDAGKSCEFSSGLENKELVQNPKINFLYKCQKCEFQATDLSSYKNHACQCCVFIYNCIVCPLSTCSKDFLKHHYYSCHFKDIPYVCCKCNNKNYSNKDFLIEHVLLTHPNINSNILIEHNYSTLGS